MNEKVKSSGSQVNWFVGSSFGATDDQTARFISEGIWEVRNPTEKEGALVRSIKVGERIAIKASYVRKRGLPFDNRGQMVSVLAIKATGIITENPQDGERLRVDWTPVKPAREWYFYTYRSTIWRVVPGAWMADGLIAFTFEEKPQDIDRFCEDPFWRERFGKAAPEKQRFAWTTFYEELSGKLLVYRNNRAALLEGIQEMAAGLEGLLSHLAKDQYADGSSGFVRDICPFTTIGLFNRSMTDSNRRSIAAGLAKFLKVEEPVPDSFEGVPLLNNQKSWYFPQEKNRPADHIDKLWDVFEAGLAFADAEEASDAFQAQFTKAFDSAMGLEGVGWNLTMGLHWSRPRFYLSLDNNSQVYVTKKLGVPIGLNGPKKRCSGNDYLTAMEALGPRFLEAAYPVRSYPELSLAAWLYKDPTGEKGLIPGGDEDDGSDLAMEPTDHPQGGYRAAVPIVSYGVDDILKDGCFLGRAEIEQLLERLRTKKNLILQGPPGTGKTWLARRLAFALMRAKDDSKVRAVQFHPNLSYEDFVRGWRPAGDGKLSLADGVFMQAVNEAFRDPLSTVVVVIEEINRGNPAQIFGELLTLLEAGKRTPNDALELCYPDPDGRRRQVHIPENLHVIGTMNIADRSLALVDLALRRRFAFSTLEPRLGPAWREWVVNACNVDPALAEDIERRVTQLNNQIAGDARLGKQSRVGHSYVTPSHRLEGGESRGWFRQVVETEILPLLEEYWFDEPGEAQKARDQLLQEW